MSKNEKAGLAGKFKAGFNKATSAAGAIAKIGFVKAKAGVGFAAGKAAQAKDAVDDKTRELLDKAHANQSSEAKATVSKLRTANPGMSPSEILDLVAAELKSVETRGNVEADGVIEAAAVYVFSAIEIHGDQVSDRVARQRLIDAIVIINSGTAKSVAMYGGAAVALLAVRFGAVEKVLSLATRGASKAAAFAPLIALAGIKNPGKKSVSWLVLTATSKILGPAPQTWGGKS